MSGTIDHAAFLQLLGERFPDVTHRIDDHARGLLHLETATFARATQAAIDTGDEATVREHFRFAEMVLSEASPEVDNALHISYLENLRFDGKQAGPMQARRLLPPRLRRALAVLERYLATLFEDD